MLSIRNLSVSIQDKNILNDLSLDLMPGQVHAVMGPNGSGKSTLAYTMMGHPSYEIQSGEIIFCGEKLNELSPDKRAKLGVFLAFQYPLEIEGVTYIDFLRQAYNAIHGGTEKQLGLRAFRELVDQKLNSLKISKEFIERTLNVGFSGGEKKRAEILQLAVLQPKLVILDEIDSGLDIDALKIVCDGLLTIKKENPEMTILVITHYQRILNYIIPDFVHVVHGGKVIKSGNSELALELEAKGYEVENSI